MKALAHWLIFTSIWATTSIAGPTVVYEDATVVNRSEIIVVGHLKDNSIRYVERTNDPPGYPSWSEYHAILVISEVMKGTSTNAEIPIILHYGLKPIIRGALAHEVGKDSPADSVGITTLEGREFGGWGPVLDDASKDNIWFLRRGGGIYGERQGPYDLGVMDPQDMEPLRTKEYFGLYLTPNPEEAVKAYAAKHPEVARQVQQWASHLEIERSCKIEDTTNRFESLLPHYLNHEFYPELGPGIISCGKVGGEGLVSVFQDPKHKDLRSEIIRIWLDMNYKEGVPLLVQALEYDDLFWSEQDLRSGWRSANPGSALTQKRQDISAEEYYSVAALRKFRDPRSKAVLEMTQRRLESIPFDDPRVLEECDGALKELSNGE
jgi:hypothetical protein